MLKERHLAHPGRGRGHYSADRQRWWDDGLKQWFRLSPAQDTLEIGLEDSGGGSRVGGVLTTLVPQGQNSYYRFVGVAHSQDSRWPTYRITGDTFPGPRSLLGDLPPEDEWAPGMTRSLINLRTELLAEGWLPTGRGEHPWSTRYSRACFEAPSGIPSPREPSDG